MKVTDYLGRDHRGRKAANYLMVSQSDLDNFLSIQQTRKPMPGTRKDVGFETVTTEEEWGLESRPSEFTLVFCTFFCLFVFEMRVHRNNRAHKQMKNARMLAVIEQTWHH